MTKPTLQSGTPVDGSRPTDPRYAQDDAPRYGAGTKSDPPLPRRRPRAWLDLADRNSPVVAISLRLNHRKVEQTRDSDGVWLVTIRASLACGDCDHTVLDDLYELNDERKFEQFLDELVQHALLTGCGLRHDKEIDL